MKMPSYKEKVKRWHDRKIIPRTFEPGQVVLLYNSRLRLFPGKQKSRWFGPYFIKTVYPYGAIEIYIGDADDSFKVNGQRIKHYYGHEEEEEDVEIPLGTH